MLGNSKLLFTNPKRVFYLILFGSLSLVCVALFMEYFMALKPCILCQLQRVALVLVAFLALLGILFQRESLGLFRMLLVSCLIGVFFGLSLSIRQLYLQNLPPELVPSCSPDLGYLLTTLPFLEVLWIAIQGDGNCAKIVWDLFGITIPGWALIGFIMLGIYIFLALKLSNDIHSQIYNR